MLKGMRRFLLAFFLVALAAIAANYRLYLKDGGFHLVREHKVLGDRVQYYSIERGELEEIPIEMVDLAKTKKELDARKEETAEERKMLAEEAAAEREIRKITASIPEAPGVYRYLDNKVSTLKAAEVTVVNDKRRQVLKVLSPIPVVAGKNTVEIPGTSATTTYSERRPEFYFRLSKPQQFGLVQIVAGKKGTRIVETVQLIPVSKQKIEERKDIEIFRQQLDEGLYKVWPQADLPAGDYAWIEFTEGEVNLQVWDFRIQ